VRILTFNCGSSSIKTSVFAESDGATLEAVASASVAGLPVRPVGRIRDDASEDSFDLDPSGGYAGAAAAILDALEGRGLLEALDAVGHRVVHGGAWLTAPTLLSPDTIARIEGASELAPLHNAPALEAIRVCGRRFPNLPMAATFDTAFFAGLPPEASTYALPGDLARKLGIRRFGFHGLAHRDMWRRLTALSGRTDLKAVTLQLGAGCSAAAIRAGKAVDTSMGFTPLEGLVMTTRSGDIDPALPLYLVDNAGFSPDDVDELLNKRSGLLGLSGRSADVRDLLTAEAAGDEDARLALGVFCYRVRKYIGAYAAAVGGLDAVVFGGGIGENSAELRARICAGFDWLGLELDDRANASAAGRDARLSGAASRVVCYTVAVDEATVIAEDTLDCLKGKDGGEW
jgi:acetate kinase